MPKCLVLLFLLSIRLAALSEKEFALSIDSIKKHLSVLADDSLAGRGTGEEGGYKAARYIASHLNQYSFEPLVEGSFYQQIPFIGITPQKSSDLELIISDKKEKLKLGIDYLVYSSGFETYLPSPVELIFAGFGIFAPEYDYNDYQEINVEGKIVVIFPGEPYSDDEEYFLGEENSMYCSPELKQRIALSRGARGVIILTDPADEYYKEWDYYKLQYSFEEVLLAYNRSVNFCLMLNSTLNSLIFSNCGYSVQQILEMKKSNSLKSFNMHIQLVYKLKSNNRNFIAPNVAAIKKGVNPDLRDTYILLTAHYDHLGTNQPINGDSIYNGFIDNASGTSILLEIVRALSHIETQRSVVVIFTTAEEKGLLGSSYYTDNPLVPLYKTVCNINIDGVNILDSTRSMTFIGAEFSNLEDILKPVCMEHNLYVSKVAKRFNASESFSNSDQFSFAKAGIPSVILTEGTDYINIPSEKGIEYLIKWMENIYHSPFDDKNQNINYMAMSQHANLILSCILYMSTHTIEPKWEEGVPFIRARLNSLAEKR